MGFIPLIPLAYFGLRLSFIDFKTHRLPNRLVAWFTAFELLALLAANLGASDFQRLLDSLQIGALNCLAYLILYALSRGSLGMGDVKFAFPLGLCIGWFAANYWLYSIFGTFLLAGFVAGLGMAAKQISRKSRIALGPYMFASTIVICGIAVLSQ